jgi:hypothetical protein
MLLICSFRDSHSRPHADPDIPILKEAKADYAKRKDPETGSAKAA